MNFINPPAASSSLREMLQLAAVIGDPTSAAARLTEIEEATARHNVVVEELRRRQAEVEKGEEKLAGTSAVLAVAQASHDERVAREGADLDGRLREIERREAAVELLRQDYVRKLDSLRAAEKT